MATPKKKKEKDPSFDASKPIKKNINQERFCFFYASGKNMDTFGNAYKSYVAAFGFQEKLNKANEELTVIPYNHETKRKEKRQEIQRMENSCRSNASHLLTNHNIIARCDHLLLQLYSEQNADSSLAWAMAQTKDVASKVAAVREFNRVRNRVKDKVEGEIVIRWQTDEDLAKEKEKNV